MDALHKLMLTGEITGAAIASLIALSFTISRIRTAISGAAKPFNYATDVVVAELRAAQEGWLHRMLVTFDIAFNVIVLRGQQDETISTHSWRAQQEGKTWGKLMCMWLNGFQPNHGPRAAAGDLERAKSRVQQLGKLLGA